jgi:hypothetical protein
LGLNPFNQKGQRVVKDFRRNQFHSEAAKATKLELSGLNLSVLGAVVV